MSESQDNSDPVLKNSREPFEPLGFTPASDDVIVGTDQADILSGDPLPEPPGNDHTLPGALAFWSFDDGVQGLFQDARGGPQAAAYRLLENQAVLQTTTPTRTGPDGTPDTALAFNGEDSFAFIDHHADLQVTQGTVSLWLQPDDLSDDAIALSKDQSGAGDGGHFRLGHRDDGRIFVRFAEGDGGSNHAWTSSKAYFQEGTWTHLAVSFTEDGITVYADGVAVPDFGWYREEGNLDSPALALEAYLLMNEEPWVLGADTSGTEHNNTAAEFDTDDEHLDDPFDGAIAQFGLWGGFTPADALDATQVWNLFNDGPGTALTAPSGPQPILAGNDFIDAGDGNDTVHGDAGNDELLGGNGHDTLDGGYGDDLLDGGAGDDVLDGGRGSDLLLGGDGDDLLVSRSDAGEQRIGQLAIGQATREDPDNEVNFERQKLYGWEDQPLVADDILVGGDGADTFLFNPQINAKLDILLRNTDSDTRTIDWSGGGVAGENDELHDHWVDSFGIDIIADYRAGEDTIAIIGHTVTPEVTHRLIDTDGDGINDEAISIITVYSNQGNNGGAHTQDLIGQIVVRGDLVDAEDIVREAGVTHGIIDNIDQLQEALAPSGTPKTSVDAEGNLIVGYDTRDDQGNLGAIVSNPQDFIDNPYLDSDRFDFASNVPDDVPLPVAIIDDLSHPLLQHMQFTGDLAYGLTTADSAGGFANIAHEGQAVGIAQDAGTIAFHFTAHPDSLGEGYQTLFSKDASGYVDGGHLTAWIGPNHKLQVRYQSTDETVYLSAYSVAIEAGASHHFAFSFDRNEANLFIDGVLRDHEDLSDHNPFSLGMSGNTESLVLGASTVSRTSGGLDNLKDFFHGTIEDLVVLDRVLYEAEAFKLANHALAIISTDGEIDPGFEPPVEGLVIVGTNAADQIEGGYGDDLIDARGGADTVIAGAGDDVVNAGSGRDHVSGGTGDDVINGGRGSDTLNGDDGDDYLMGRRGHDQIAGGEGDDEINGGNGRDLLDGGAGDDDITGGNSADVIHGGEGDDVLHGQRGRDFIDGDDGDDELLGGRGHDTLLGGAGDDWLDGGRRQDHLVGGAGNDELIGGRGRDLFVFESLDSGQSLGFDVVQDFRTGHDALHVSDDLAVTFEQLAGFTRMTLTDDTGTEAGSVDIFGTTVDESIDLVRTEAPADLLL